MDVKMDNISVDLLGLRLTLRLPRISLKDTDEEEAEYHLKIEQSNNINKEIEDNKMSYLEWRYGDSMAKMVESSVSEPQQEVVRAKELPKLERAAVARNNLILSTRTSQHFQRSRLLKYDQRVVNRLMTVDQIGHIEQWLNNQPDSFPVDEDSENVYESVDDTTDSPRDNPEEDVPPVNVSKSTNLYRDIANRRDAVVYYRKVTIV